MAGRFFLAALTTRQQLLPKKLKLTMWDADADSLEVGCRAPRTERGREKELCLSAEVKDRHPLVGRSFPCCMGMSRLRALSWFDSKGEAKRSFSSASKPPPSCLSPFFDDTPQVPHVERICRHAYVYIDTHLTLEEVPERCSFFSLELLFSPTTPH